MSVFSVLALKRSATFLLMLFREILSWGAFLPFFDALDNSKKEHEFAMTFARNRGRERVKWVVTLICEHLFFMQWNLIYNEVSKKMYHIYSFWWFHYNFYRHSHSPFSFSLFALGCETVFSVKLEYTEHRYDFAKNCGNPKQIQHFVVFVCSVVQIWIYVKWKKEVNKKWKQKRKLVRCVVRKMSRPFILHKHSHIQYTFIIR